MAKSGKVFTHDFGRIYRYVDENRAKLIQDLRTFLNQPSIAETGEGIKEGAELILEFLKDLGAEGEIVPLAGGKGCPGVYAELAEKEAKKTLLIYGMYDVVTVDHPERWSSPPWDANIVNDKIIARGTVNTKGPLMAFVKAVEAIKAVTRDMPVNLIFLVEGEEEPGSPNLPEFVKKYRPKLQKADAMFFPQASQLFGEKPVVTLGNNGILYVDLELRDKEADIGGIYSNVVGNPAWRIVDALASLKDDQGRVAIEGWYDDLRPPTDEELKLLERLVEQVDEETLKTLIGVKEFKDKLHGLELFKRLYFQPRFWLIGMVSGYYGPGVKSVTPAWCRAKLGFSLLPNMDVYDCYAKLKKHLEEHGFSDIEAIVKIGWPDLWTRCSLKDEINQAIIQSYRHLEYEPLIEPFGVGGAPFYLFNRSPYLKLPFGIGGFGYLFMHHRIDEFMTVDQYVNSIKFFATLLYKYAEI